MRILKLPLAGLLFCVMALFAGCKTSNEPKAPVALTWEMGASDIEPGEYLYSQEYLSKTSKKELDDLLFTASPRGEAGRSL